jgi:hypothetical protein
MNNAVPAQIVCPHCNGAIDATDNYCRHCAAPTARRAGLSGSSGVNWWESPWVVLTLLLLVLGPLALPLLWRSRRFTFHWKIVLTVIVAGVTVYVLWQAWYVLNQSLAPLQELRKLQGF